MCITAVAWWWSVALGGAVRPVNWDSEESDVAYVMDHDRALKDAVKSFCLNETVPAAYSGGAWWGVHVLRGRSAALVYRLPRFDSIVGDYNVVTDMKFVAPRLIVLGDGSGGEVKVFAVASDVEFRIKMGSRQDDGLINATPLETAAYAEAIELVAKQVEVLVKKNKSGACALDLVFTPDVNVMQLSDVCKGEAAIIVVALAEAQLRGDIDGAGEFMSPLDKVSLDAEVAAFPSKAVASKAMAGIVSEDVASRDIVYFYEKDDYYVYGFRSGFPLNSYGCGVFRKISGNWRLAARERPDLVRQFNRMSVVAVGLRNRMDFYDRLIKL